MSDNAHTRLRRAFAGRLVTSSKVELDDLAALVLDHHDRLAALERAAQSMRIDAPPMSDEEITHHVRPIPAAHVGWTFGGLDQAAPPALCYSSADIDAIKRQARDDALEEAARACDAEAIKASSVGETRSEHELRYMAAAIRALKSTPTKRTPPPPDDDSEYFGIGDTQD